MSDPLVAELAREGAMTRRVLERVPGDRLSSTPHRTSMTLGTLARHAAMSPDALADLRDPPRREVPAFTSPEAAS